jgi:peptidoglycan hydrolase-like protein with peptidoglycan-binding domain
MGGASGAGAEGVPNMNESMGELNKMMEQMTPEQREAMKGMGLGSMFGGDANKANPAGQPAQAPAGSAPSGSAKSSSADLMTGNMTQSVQMHLQALGYATGNTDGDLSTDTVIAISQFQAENGLEVTGEVTPQLLGILGARVDAQ